MKRTTFKKGCNVLFGFIITAEINSLSSSHLFDPAVWGSALPATALTAEMPVFVCLCHMRPAVSITSPREAAADGMCDKNELLKKTTKKKNNKKWKSP